MMMHHQTKMSFKKISVSEVIVETVIFLLQKTEEDGRLCDQDVTD